MEDAGAALEELRREQLPRVCGNRRIEDATVLASIFLRSGQELSGEAVRRDIRNIYRTGFFDDVRVPADNVLAEQGHGFKLAMQTFDRTRPDIGAGACGLIRRALEESIAYALERKTFGVPIAEHQMVQALIAEMGIKYEATRLLVHKSAWQIDQGGRNSLVASYSKAFGADSAMQVATDAVQVFGGNGYITEYPVEKLMRDAKILQIYEGTNQIQRMVVARNLIKEAGSLDFLNAFIPLPDHPNTKHDTERQGAAASAGA